MTSRDVLRGVIAWAINTLLGAAVAIPLWLLLGQPSLANAVVKGLVTGGVLAILWTLGTALTPGMRVAQRVIRET
jgi:hypothetical protein